MPTKHFFVFLCFLLTIGTFTAVFKDHKLIKRHKFFACSWMDPNPKKLTAYQWHCHCGLQLNDEQTKNKGTVLRKYMPMNSTHPTRRQTLDTGAVTRFGSIIPTVYFFPGLLICPILQCCGSALVSLRIRISLIFSMRIRIRIQGAKQMRIRGFKNPFERQETRFIC